MRGAEHSCCALTAQAASSKYVPPSHLMQHKLKLDSKEENVPATVYGIQGPDCRRTSAMSTQPLSANSPVDPATSAPVSPPPQTATTGSSQVAGAAHRDNELQRHGQRELCSSPPPLPASPPSSDTDTDDEEAERRDSDHEQPPLDEQELYS